MRGFRQNRTAAELKERLQAQVALRGLVARAEALQRERSALHGDRLARRAAELRAAADAADDAAKAAFQNVAAAQNHLAQTSRPEPELRPPARARARQAMPRTHLVARSSDFNESSVVECRHWSKVEAGGITADHRLDVGTMDNECRSCGAMFWAREKNSNGDYKLCCDVGDVNLPALQPFPEPLKASAPRAPSCGQTHARLPSQSLLRNADFKKKFRQYQSAFQCASTGMVDRTLPGLSSFIVQGKLYHVMSSGALPNDDSEARTFLQVYTLDDQAAAARRGDIFKGLDKDVLASLTSMMSEVNPYVGKFKALANSTTPTARLILQGAPTAKKGATVNGQDARTYSLPSASEVAVLIMGADDEEQHAREVIVHKVTAAPGEGYKLMRIPTSHAAFMPLHFMLMCPRGEPGWHKDMFRAKDPGPSSDPDVKAKRKRITPKDYSKFYMHTRAKNEPDDNPRHCCGRGWQEWMCEHYALEEEINLSFLRSAKGQDKLRRTSFDHITSANATTTGAEVRASWRVTDAAATHTLAARRRWASACCCQLRSRAASATCTPGTRTRWRWCASTASPPTSSPSPATRPGRRSSASCSRARPRQTDQTSRRASST